MVLCLKYLYLCILQNRIFGEKGKLPIKCILCILLKASISELWHNILLWCSGAITTPFDLVYALALCIDIVSYMSTLWSCFVVRDGYTSDLDHPHELLMHTGRKPGKSWSWVDTSLSPVFVETVVSGTA